VDLPPSFCHSFKHGAMFGFSRLLSQSLTFIRFLLGLGGSKSVNVLRHLRLLQAFTYRTGTTTLGATEHEVRKVTGVGAMVNQTFQRFPKSPEMLRVKEAFEMISTLSATRPAMFASYFSCRPKTGCCAGNAASVQEGWRGAGRRNVIDPTRLKEMRETAMQHLEAALAITDEIRCDHGLHHRAGAGSATGRHVAGESGFATAEIKASRCRPPVRVARPNSIARLKNVSRYIHNGRLPFQNLPGRQFGRILY
jgi:hypothetical protein